MVVRFGAVYQGGLLHPTSPLGFLEGSTVELTVASVTEKRQDILLTDGRRAFLLLNKIVDLPESPKDVEESVSDRVDEILYGGPNGAL